MAFLKLPRKFFCFELETGALLIGYIGSIACTLFIAVSIAELLIDSTILQQKPILTIAYEFVLLPLYVSLIQGTKKQNHKFLLPWLIVNGIFLILATVLVPILIILAIVVVVINYNNSIVLTISDGKTLEFSAAEATVLAFLYCVLILAFYILIPYIYLTVFALYSKFREESKCVNVENKKK